MILEGSWAVSGLGGSLRVFFKEDFGGRVAVLSWAVRIGLRALLVVCGLFVCLFTSRLATTVHY